MALPKNQNDVGNINLINSGMSTSTDILPDPIYDMKPNVEGLDSSTDKKEDTTDKKRIQSTISSSAVTAADLYAEQMTALTSDPAYRVTPIQDSTAVGITGSDSTYFSTGANLKAKQSFGSQFDNVNEDNVNSYYTTGKKIGTGIGNIFKSAEKGIEGFGESMGKFQEQVKSAGMAPLLAVATGVSGPAPI